MSDDAPFMEDLVRRVLRGGHPASIILFGSEAHGEARSHSDIDLLIIEREGADDTLPRRLRSANYRMALLGIDRDIDLLVYTPQEVLDWSNVPNAFITTALREGRVLYENRG